ncbi:MAG: hypothetical protein V8Q43_00020 [Christensenellaceae bacterium]
MSWRWAQGRRASGYFRGQARIERFIGLKDIASYIARVQEMAEKKAALFA